MAKRIKMAGAVQPGRLVEDRRGNKRQAIVDAARELFTTVGYEETTIADVATRAGVAVGTVYLYFKSKPDLIYAVKGDWEQELLDFLARPELGAIPHHQRARAIIQACFDLCGRGTEIVQMMGLQPQEVGQFKPAAQEGRIQQAIQVFLEEGVAAGAFRPIDMRLAAVLAYGMVVDALMQCFRAEGGQGQEHYINALVDVFEHWLLQPAFLES